LPELFSFFAFRCASPDTIMITANPDFAFRFSFQIQIPGRVSGCATFRGDDDESTSELT
jgi:hypothetical protein